MQQLRIKTVLHLICKLEVKMQDEMPDWECSGRLTAE